MAFNDSFNSALRSGATLQAILYGKEQRDLENQERRANEFSRGIDALEQQFGSANPADWPDEGRVMLNDHMNSYSDQVGTRPGGTATFLGIHKAGDGVAAEVQVDDGNGKTSRGPITKKGTSDDDDEVVVINNTAQLKAPVQANLDYLKAKFNARVHSENANTRFTQTENGRSTENAFEQLYGSGVLGGSDNPQGPVDTPAEQAPPVVEDGPSQGLRSAAATGPAVTAPAKGVSSFKAEPLQVAGSGFKYTGAQYAPEVDSTIAAVAENNGVSADLVRAVVQQESRGDPSAQSHTGASGLMQITKSAVDEVNRVYGTSYTRDQMRTDPKANVEVGTKYLAHLLKQYNGNVEQALAAYNGGPGHLKKAGGDYTKTRPETANYVPAVMKNLAAADQAPSAEAQAPSPKTPEQRRDLRNLEGMRAAVAQLEAKPASGSTERATVADRAKLEHAKAALAKAEESYAQGGTVPGTLADATKASDFSPKDKAEEAIVAEADATEIPTEEADLVQVAETVKQIKPAKKLTEQDRKAIYTLHRLNPQQFPIDQVVTALKTGRLTKTDWKSYTNAADQMVMVDDEGNQRVLPDTPEAKAVREAKLAKAQNEAAYADVQHTQALQQGQLQQTKARTDFFLEQTANIHGDDPEQKAELRDKYNVTIDSMGLNPDAQETATAINKAARIQNAFNADNGPAWYNLWLKDQPYQNDFSMGLAVQNMPNSRYDPSSPDMDEVTSAANHYKANYFDPMQEKFPDLDKAKVTQATYIATHLEKKGMDREDAIRVAGQVSMSGRFQTPGQIIKAIDSRMAQQ